MQPKDITLESVRRTCQAAADLESLDAIAAGHRHGHGTSLDDETSSSKNLTVIRSADIGAGIRHWS